MVRLGLVKFGCFLFVKKQTSTHTSVSSGPFSPFTLGKVAYVPLVTKQRPWEPCCRGRFSCLLRPSCDPSQNLSATLKRNCIVVSCLSGWKLYFCSGNSRHLLQCVHFFGWELSQGYKERVRTPNFCKLFSIKFLRLILNHDKPNIRSYLLI